MGTYINVNLDALSSAESALSEYSSTRKRYVGELKLAVENTGKAWEGDDTKAFKLKWDAMSASDGVFTVTEENINAYNSLLSAAYNAYRKAQSESVEQASKIGGW